MISAQNHSFGNNDTFQQKQLRNDILSRPETRELFNKLDADQTLVGAGVIYIDKHYTIVQLRQFKPVCRIKPINIIIHEVPPKENLSDYSVKLRNHGRPSQLMGEAAGTLTQLWGSVFGMGSGCR